MKTYPPRAFHYLLHQSDRIIERNITEHNVISENIPMLYEFTGILLIAYMYTYMTWLTKETCEY